MMKSKKKKWQQLLTMPLILSLNVSCLVAEVPILLHELFENANYYITDENYAKALLLLSKACNLLNSNKVRRAHKNTSLLLGAYHNIALCYQKIGNLSLCCEALEKCIYMAEDTSGNSTQFSNGFQRVKYLCRTYMQLCALQSQLKDHEDALKSALISAQYGHLLFQKFLIFCKEMSYRAESKPDLLNNYDNYDIPCKSLFEISSIHILPIIEAIANKLISDGTRKANIDDKMNLNKIDLKNLFGFLTIGEWVNNINIGNIMQISQFTIQDLYSSVKEELELSRESLIDKICLIVSAYFCIATEKRFLSQFYEECKDNAYSAALTKESEFWHAKSLQIAYEFLPSNSLLMSHILFSYQKHYSTISDPIPESQECSTSSVHILKPLKGNIVSQYQPIVRMNSNANIILPAIPKQKAESLFNLKSKEIKEDLSRSKNRFAKIYGANIYKTLSAGKKSHSRGNSRTGSKPSFATINDSNISFSSAQFETNHNVSFIQENSIDNSSFSNQKLPFQHIRSVSLRKQWRQKKTLGHIGNIIDNNKEESKLVAPNLCIPQKPLALHSVQNKVAAKAKNIGNHMNYKIVDKAKAKLKDQSKNSSNLNC